MNSAREDLFNKIIKVYPALSPKKRRVADFILKDHKKVFLMTAREIAEECQISEPTIIRFTNDLGFSGYMEFVQYMKGLLHIELTAVDRLQKASRQSDETNTLDKYCKNTIDNIENLRNTISKKDLKNIFTICDSYPVSDVSPNRHQILPLLFRMLYGCGLRISEALKLKLNEVDLKQGTLFIREAKFGKERIVPMAETLTERCRQYAVKVHNYESCNPFFYQSPFGGRYKESTIYKLFR